MNRDAYTLSQRAMLKILNSEDQDEIETTLKTLFHEALYYQNQQAFAYIVSLARQRSEKHSLTQTLTREMFESTLQELLEKNEQLTSKIEQQTIENNMLHHRLEYLRQAENLVQQRQVNQNQAVSVALDTQLGDLHEEIRRIRARIQQEIGND